MKSVYICHPFTTFGDARTNFSNQIRIGREVLKAGFIPVSPIITFGMVIPHDPGNYELAIGSCLWLLSKCDLLWTFGQWEKSKGCKIEVSKAMSSGIPVENGFAKLGITGLDELPQHESELFL